MQLLESLHHVALIRDERGQTFVHLADNADGRLVPVRSRAFRLWLTRRSVQLTGDVASNTTLSAVVNLLEAQADRCPPQRLWNRVARARDGAIWLDLCDGRGGAVEISAAGFRIAACPPLFRRFTHQQPVPAPAPGGDLAVLCDLLNLPDEGARVLFLVSQVVALVPDIPQPLLLLTGPQGSAKTTAARLRRALVDPSCVPTLIARREPDELVQALDHHYMPVLDNLSGLTALQEEILCQAATGAGFTKRALYSDQDDVVYRFCRPVVLTGINLPSAAPDLLDRALVIHMERIAATERRDEQSLWAAFERERPRLLGGLLGVLSRALLRAPGLQLPGLWRMADFTRLGAAVAVELGWSVGRFCEALAANSARQAEVLLEEDPLAGAVRALLELRGAFSGSATALLEALGQVAVGAGLPRNPAALGRRLNGLRTPLRELGIQVQCQRAQDVSRERQWVITR